MNISRKLHILYHFRVRGTGAEGVHISGIANGFRSAGNEVSFVSPTGIDPTKESETDKNNSTIKSVLMHFFADRAPQFIFEIGEIFYNFKAIMNLKKVISEKQVNFIYERYAFFMFAGAYIATKEKIPLIIEINELSGYNRVRGQLFIRLMKYIERKVFSRASISIVVSDFLKEKIIEMTGSRENILVIPNGVPQSWFKNKIDSKEKSTLLKSYHLEDRKILGFIGCLAHWHNFDLLLDAIAQLKTNLKDLVLILIGSGPEKNNIICGAKVRGIEDAVFIIDNVHHSKIPLYLNIFDVGVIPHSNEYRSPIKLFEYMASGLAVVAPKTPPIRKIIEDGVDALLFDPNCLDQFVNALSRLLSDNDYRNEIGQKAHQKIKSSYTWEKHASQILESYHEIESLIIRNN